MRSQQARFLIASSTLSNPKSKLPSYNGAAIPGGLMKRSTTLAAAAWILACGMSGCSPAAGPATEQKAPAAADAPPVAGQLGALAPANLKADRPKAPFDMTGTWF